MMADLIALPLAIAFTAIPIILIAAIIGNKDKNESVAFEVLTTVSVSLFCYIAVNGVVTMVSGYFSWQDARPASFLEAQTASGFQSGYEYPLALGDRGYVSHSSEKVTHGLFYFSMTSQTVSGSSILVSYEHADGTREIVEIPISTINFRITANGGDTSLSVDLGAIDTPADGYVIRPEYEYSCPEKVVWGWWVTDCSAAPTTMTTPGGNEGVAKFLQRAFAASPSKIVTMTVTEEKYSKILGAPESS